MILIFCAPLTFPLNAATAKSTTSPYLVIDVKDGAIIAAHHENDQWYPASLTKLMTAYVTMNAISAGEIEPGSPVRISKSAARMPASRMGYQPGTLLRIDTALKILIVKSANDVAVALAQSVAGSVENFTARMNKIAKQLGMTASHFTNPNGLHSRLQVTSAKDLAILSRRLLLDYPQYANWFAIPAIRTAKKTHYSYNLLLERFIGANGMKTGFVCASGYNMVASAKRNNRQLVAVILGEKSQVERAITAARLLLDGFVNIENPIDSLLSASHSGNKPVNMRSQLCTQKARKNRYEPGAGKAVIKSEFLQKRVISRQPTKISTGGVDGPQAPGVITQLSVPKGKVVIPQKRPDFQPARPIDEQWQTKPKLRGSIPLPIWRPQS